MFWEALEGPLTALNSPCLHQHCKKKASSCHSLWPLLWLMCFLCDAPNARRRWVPPCLWLSLQKHWHPLYLSKSTCIKVLARFVRPQCQSPSEMRAVAKRWQRYVCVEGTVLVKTWLQQNISKPLLSPPYCLGFCQFAALSLSLSLCDRLLAWSCLNMTHILNGGGELYLFNCLFCLALILGVLPMHWLIQANNLLKIYSSMRESLCVTLEGIVSEY